MTVIQEDTMSPKERISTYLQGQLPDRVPCVPLVLNCAARVLGVSINRYNSDGQTMGQAHIAAFKKYRHDFLTLFTTTSTLAEAMGTRLYYPDDDAPQVETPLIKSYDDLPRVKGVDPEKDGRLPVYLEATEICINQVGDEVFVGTVMGGPFTTAAALRGTDLFVRDLYRNPEFAHQLLSLCLQSCLAFTEAIISRGGIPVLVEPVASGSLISPRHFREFVTPYCKPVANRIHEAGLPAILHICGKTTQLWKTMLETNYDIWSLDAVDMSQARNEVGDKVCLMGNVSPVNLLKSSAEEIDREARELCQNLVGNPRGFILASGCEVPINTPPENILTLVDAARKYGRFQN